MHNRLVKNKRLLLSIPLLLASLFLASQAVPSAHAQFTGLVCITASTTATSCPTSAPVLGPFTAGQTFTVGVFIQGSDAMGGFDIYVHSDPTFVTPTSAALGGLIVSPSLTSICVNGSASIGACTIGTANGAGTVEVTTIEGAGINECGGISPCSGLAFTITYSVVATTSSTTLSYPTATGCATSSVATPLNTCVLVDNAIGGTLPETIQGASVSIVLPLGVVCITSSSTATSCPIGAPNISVAFGSTYTVGVFVQNSAPLGGFRIFVSVDPHYLNPISAALGTLITSPSLTDICINGSAQTGACSPPSGPGIVQVDTVESSGANDPGTGLAFTITYKVVGVTPSTSTDYPRNSDCSVSSISSPSNVCVLIEDNVGTPLPENTQVAMAGQIHGPDKTRMIISCLGPVVVGQSTTCTGIVNDNATSLQVPPVSVDPFFNHGLLTWSSAGTGSFNPNSCTLSAMNATASTCQVTYSPTGVGNGIHGISALYGGDTIHSGGSTGPISLTVLPATATIATAVIVDQTGLPVNATTGVPFGLKVHDTVVFLGGYPITGATGSVTYTLFPNGACIAGTGTIIGSPVPVTAADNVAGSASVLPPVGSNSIDATYTPSTADNAAVVSACEQFTVTPAPSFTAGKLHWTHHLSLSKSASTQGWTAIVTNPLSVTAKIVVRITGVSTINPSLTFDITCGVTCVNTATTGVNFTPGLTPVSVVAGTSSTSFSFNQIIPGSFVNQKFTFTATLYWATGTLYTASNSKSGAFAVVP